MQVLITIVAFLLAGTALNATGAVIKTVGSGTVVTTVEAVADFENIASLGQTYSEGGLTFNRVNYTLNNNGCGFAGCSSSFHPVGFVGNYFYGQAINPNLPAFIQIIAEDGKTLAGIEFITGFSVAKVHAHYWEAFLDGDVVGSGTGTHDAGTTLGFGSMAFDELRFTSRNILFSTITSFNEGSRDHSASIDRVRVQFQTNSIPEAPVLSLIIIALAGFSFCRRQPKASNKYAAV